MAYSGEMDWTRCDPGVLPGLLEARTHEVTVVHDWEWGAIGLAAPRTDGETVDPNEVFIDAFASGIVNDALAGGRHARTVAELSLDGMVAAFVTRSRLATGRQQQSIMYGELPPIAEATGPTLGERFTARNGGDTLPISWVTESTTAVTASSPAPPRVMSGPAAGLPAAPRLADARPAPSVADPDRPVNPCGDCIFAGGLEQLAQDNAVVTVLEGVACVRFMEGEGGDRRISGTATVRLPASSGNWSQAEVAQYAIGKVLDGTRGCSDNGSGNISVSKGWLGILGSEQGCSGLVGTTPPLRKLLPKSGFADISNAPK